ncbi:MAG: SpoIIE family protein phosphatase [Bacteroidia bacterium]|nr:SpoIIE family protein phosphatase [Bacteroidia bacterium]
MAEEIKIKKRSSIFRQLVLLILLPVVISILGYSYFNYTQNSNRLIEADLQKRKLITDQIRTSMNMFDAGSQLLEKNLDEKMVEMSNRIIDFYKKDTAVFSKTDADLIAEKADLDTSVNDMYVFNNDKVIFNATFKKDVGFDFKKLGDRYVKFLDSIKTLDHCFPERTSIQYATNRPRKFSYHATPDKKYILELSFTSPGYENLQNIMFGSIDSLNKNFTEIRKITLYMATEIFPTFDKTAILKETHKPAMTQVYKTGQAKEIVEEENEQRLTYSYYFLDMKGSNMHDGWIIQFITDDSNQKKLIARELKNLGWLLLLTVLPLFLLIWFGTKRLTNPIKILAQKVNRISSGSLNERVEIKGNNEITELSSHFNKMVNDLQDSYNTLEQKVKDRTSELEHQKEIVEEKQKEIVDSINYAQRIQKAMMASDHLLNENLQDYFVFFKPKDIVSGDFYWACTVNDLKTKEQTNHSTPEQINQLTENRKPETVLKRFYLAVCDSTGHGVPGAFMSLLNINFLNEAINEKNILAPNDVLNFVRKRLMESPKDESGESAKDGMDGVLMCFSHSSEDGETDLLFAAANNPVLLLRENATIEFTADKMPIGKSPRDEVSFRLQTEKLKQGDKIYCYTDGFADQFGGPKGKKFKYKPLQEFIISNAHLSSATQKTLFNETFDKWKGLLEQIDDVLIVGINI